MPGVSSRPTSQLRDCTWVGDWGVSSSSGPCRKSVISVQRREELNAEISCMLFTQSSCSHWFSQSACDLIYNSSNPDRARHHCGTFSYLPLIFSSFLCSSFILLIQNLSCIFLSWLLVPTFTRISITRITLIRIISTFIKSVEYMSQSHGHSTPTIS